MLGDADPLLRRLERNAIVACALMAVAAVVMSGGRLGPALGVLGGGLLIAVSYRSIGAGTSALVALLAPPGAATAPGLLPVSTAPGAASPAGTAPAAPPRVGQAVVALVGRYALLALLAYVMIARLRLHPLGVMAGASSVVAATAVEAFRLILKKS